MRIKRVATFAVLGVALTVTIGVTLFGAARQVHAEGAGWTRIL
jgi:hypothetical protein